MVPSVTCTPSTLMEECLACGKVETGPYQNDDNFELSAAALSVKLDKMLCKDLNLETRSSGPTDSHRLHQE